MNRGRFEITAHNERCLLRIAMSGHWDQGTVTRYKKRVIYIVGKMLSAGCPSGRFLALVDTRKLTAQSQEVIAMYRVEFEGSHLNPRRLATIVSSALVKRQVERIALPNQKLFENESDALGWLLSPDGR